MDVSTGSIHAANAVRGPAHVRVIAETTGLSIDSVRNALRRLIDEGDVRVNGGWGVKGTTYQVTGAQPRS